MVRSKSTSMAGEGHGPIGRTAREIADDKAEAESIAAANSNATDEAVAASTDNAGLAQGDAAKSAIVKGA